MLHLLPCLLSITSIIIHVKGQSEIYKKPLEWNFLQFHGTENGLGTWIGGDEIVILSSRTSQTWEFDYSITPVSRAQNGTWTQIDSSKKPLPRNGAAITSLRVGNDVYAIMFGGKSSDLSKKAVSRNSAPGLFGDTWLYLNKEWEQVTYPPTGALPVHRSKHSMSMISGTSSILMFGGSSSLYQTTGVTDHTFLNEAWTYTYGIGWINVTSASANNMPSKRVQSGMAPIGEKLVLLFGGSNGLIGQDSLTYDDTWVYNHSVTTETNVTHRWRQLFPVNKPSKRMNHAMVDLGEHVVVLYGGSDLQVVLDDVWIFNRTSSRSEWYQFNQISSEPDKRHNPGLTRIQLNNGEQRAFLFGGKRSENDLSDAYVLNMLTGVWEEVTHFVSPSPRSHHASAGNYLYGGRAISSTDQKIILSDTWWYTDKCGSKRCWEKLKSAETESPPALQDHEMSTFGTSVVLFGGSTQGQNANFNDETWVLNDNRVWKQIYLSPGSVKPTGRIFHQMAEIGPLGGGNMGMVLLFGGNTDGVAGSLCGTWLLYKRYLPTIPSSEEWTWYNTVSDLGDQLDDGVHPKNRGGHSMATLNTETVLMFGGCNLDTTNQVCTSGTFYEHTWLYSVTDHSATGQWVKLNITGDVGYKRPHGRVHAAMSTFGGGQNRGILFGGKRPPGPPNRSTVGSFLGLNSDYILLEDTWMFTFDEDGGGYRWLRLDINGGDFGQSSVPHARVHSSWLSIKSSLLLFGGVIQHDDGPAYEFKTAGDSWFLEEGCPPGTYLKNKESLKAGCSNCPLGTYNDNTDPAPSCDVCPVGTTTRKPGRQRKTQCDVCNLTAQTPFGACIVENYKSVWTCNPGGYGPECSKLGCGGIQIERKKLCHGRGTCSDGINGTGACECVYGTHGSSCSKQCPGFDEDKICGHEGICSETGECLCSFLYQWSFGVCVIPVKGIVLFVLIALAIGIGVVIFFNTWQKKEVHKFEELEKGYRDAMSNLEQGWIVDWADLKLTELIARGAYGEVWKSKWAMLPQSTDVAVKKILHTATSMTSNMDHSGGTKEVGPSINMENIFRDNEIKLLMRTRHRRVCLFLGAGITDTGNIFMVHEYVPGGNLREVLDDLTIVLALSRKIGIAKDIAEGMEFLHGRNLIHRDLKSLNVLIDESGRAKIADFGLSRFTSAKDKKNRVDLKASFAAVDNKELRTTLNKDAEQEENIEKLVAPVSGETKNKSVFFETKKGRRERKDSTRGESTEMTGNRGSVLWMAPEILSQTGDTAVYGFGADVYSFGIVLFEIATQRLPWAKVKPPFTSNVWSKLKEGIRPTLVTDKEKQHLLVPLMEACWSQSPDDRPSFKQCKEICHQLLKKQPRRSRLKSEPFLSHEVRSRKQYIEMTSSSSIRSARTVGEEYIHNPLMNRTQLDARKTVAVAHKMMSNSEVQLKTASMSKKKSRSFDLSKKNHPYKK